MNVVMIIIIVLFIGTISALTPKDPPYGALSVKGSKLIGSDGKEVQLTGMSLYWSQWMGQYWTKDVVDALACKWNANLVRAAMGVTADVGGYLKDKAPELAKLRTVVEAAIEAGIYVLIDWHAGDPATKSDAIEFFKQMATDYGKYSNVLYELLNEPEKADWDSVIKPYHKDVLAAIRAIDKDNVAILGTPDWSGSIDKAKASPLTGEKNIMYTVHFYTGADASWQETQRKRVAQYVSEGFPIFVTEFGVSKEDGGKTGGIYTDEANKWFSVLDTNKISYANWAVDDAPESSAALKPGTSPTQVGEDSVLTDSGKFIKAKLKSMDTGVKCSGTTPPTSTPKPT